MRGNQRLWRLHSDDGHFSWSDCALATSSAWARDHLESSLAWLRSHEAQSSFKNNKQIYGNILIGCFQVGDVLGRTIAGPVGRCLGPSRLWALVLLRFAFVPLFMLGQRSPETSELWGSDVGRMALCALFAISNGLAANLAMMFGPACCSVQEKKEVAGAWHVGVRHLAVFHLYCKG